MKLTDYIKRIESIYSAYARKIMLEAKTPSKVDELERKGAQELARIVKEAERRLSPEDFHYVEYVGMGRIADLASIAATRIGKL